MLSRQRYFAKASNYPKQVTNSEKGRKKPIPPRKMFSPVQLLPHLCGCKTQPDLQECKSPGIASAKRHHTLSCVFGNMTGTANDVVYDSAYSAAFYPAFLVGLVPKRLLPNHAKQIIGNEGKL